MKQIKIFIKLLLRKYDNFRKGYSFRFCKRDKENIQYDFSLSFQQEIKPSETFQNKVFNLKKASELINGYTIYPNEIFSFWNIIGNPNSKFKESRSIIKGIAKNQIGGGICQVSGLIYYTAIKARLEILERYNHSLDLYTDDTRFAPLGTDATVVYGYKDLMIGNPYEFPIKFFLSVDENTSMIKIKLFSTQYIKENELYFDKSINGTNSEIKVSYADGTLVNVSKYSI